MKISAITVESSDNLLNLCCFLISKTSCWFIVFNIPHSSEFAICMLIDNGSGSVASAIVVQSKRCWIDTSLSISLVAAPAASESSSGWEKCPFCNSQPFSHCIWLRTPSKTVPVDWHPVIVTNIYEVSMHTNNRSVNRLSNTTPWLVKLDITQLIVHVS